MQRCVFTATWTCSTFHGTGTSGGAANQLSWAFGLGRNASGDTIYIADSNNGRVKRCATSGTCSIPITGVNWPADVAVDAGGNVFVSSYYDFTVRKYSSSGSFLGIFAGVEDVPYVTDGLHYNAPWGVAVAPDGSIYIAESSGYRLIKLNRNGVPQWTVGSPASMATTTPTSAASGATLKAIWRSMLPVASTCPTPGTNAFKSSTPMAAIYLTFGEWRQRQQRVLVARPAWRSVRPTATSSWWTSVTSVSRSIPAPGSTG